MQTINDVVQRLGELRELQAGGVKLPYSDTAILKFELGGNVVDLMTGEINILPGANGRHRPMAKGEAEGG